VLELLHSAFGSKKKLVSDSGPDASTLIGETYLGTTDSPSTLVKEAPSCLSIGCP
tara:strand:+ start:1428 stop:1592 length:165 start_codon:yes stop_codon:yes gene_type:complete